MIRKRIVYVTRRNILINPEFGGKPQSIRERVIIFSGLETFKNILTKKGFYEIQSVLTLTAQYPFILENQHCLRCENIIHKKLDS